jgi:dTDP-4-amino-4,6-dideoxygalactose transaminase
MPVPLFDPVTPRLPLRPRIDAAIAGVLDGGRFVLGPEVAAFEREWAAWCGVEHAVGVADGTEAITIALRALGVGPGDDVVVPSFTFYASAVAIALAGARPVFCDVDPATSVVTVETVRAAMTPATKAAVLVDLFGNVPPIREVEAELGVPVVEDAAQAAGSERDGRRAGAQGTIATFSFYPSKTLGAFGDGGAVATDDAALADRVRRLRFYGSRDKETYEEVGWQSRLDELQAAILRVQLPELDGWCAARRAAGAAYAASGLGAHVALPAPAGDPAWGLYVVRHPAPDALAAHLGERGIGARGYYRVPVHRQPALRAEADLPGTDEAARTHLALPMSAVLGEAQVAEVAAAVAAFAA